MNFWLFVDGDDSPLTDSELELLDRILADIEERQQNEAQKRAPFDYC